MILEQLASIGSLDDVDHVILSLMHSKTNNYEDFLSTLRRQTRLT
jgi:hypothetical protein